MEQKINVQVKEGVSTLEIRTGEALKLKEPTPVLITGTIDAPSIFLEAKMDALNAIDSHLLVDVNKGEITFTTDEKSFYKSVVKGSLKRSKALSDIGVNDVTRFYGDKELARFIRQHMFYFDKDKANDLLIKLMKFTGNIETTLKNDADLKGNVDKAFKKLVKTDLPDSIDITCKIYEGLPAETFTANLCVEATSDFMKFYLDSPQLFVMEEEIKTAALKKEAEHFIDWGCAVINI